MIGILTFHRTTNYGALLQSYALQRTLERLGYENEIIDYRCEAIEKRYTPTPWYNYLKPKELGKLLLFNIHTRDNRYAFYDFQKRHMRISEIVYTKNTIVNANVRYDSFIVGSDQVWNGNITDWDSTYLLDFADVKKRNSYAASFGLSEISEEKKEWYCGNLQKFNSVSVRETTGQRLFHEICGNDSQVNLDPVFLLSSEEWEEISIINEETHMDDYVLVYLMAATKEIFILAKRIAEELKCKVIYINHNLFGWTGVTNLYYTKPEHWIRLFFNAKCIVTNSFHGTAFSLIFNKPFFSNLLPGKALVNSRITDLLEKLDAKEALCDGIYHGLPSLNYGVINKKIEYEKDKSIRYLKEIMDGI